jgi:hypothetical protein
MQLPQFIQAFLGFQKKVESHFDAAELLTAANTKIAQLEANAAEALKTGIAAAVAKVQADLDAANAKMFEAGAKIAALESQLEKAKGQANAVIAAQGLEPGAVPAAETKSGTEAVKETAWQTYQRLATENPRAAGSYWAENTQAILDSRPK